MAEAMKQVHVPDAVLAEFKLLKTRRRYRYQILTLNYDTFEVEVAKSAPPESKVADLLKDLPPTEARYAVFDFEFTTKDGRKADKLFFILWTPAAAGGRSKMFYTSQRRALDLAFTGVEDSQCSTLDQVRKLLGETTADDEDDGEWDPDA